MKLNTKEYQFDKLESFKEDLLDRKAFADTLTNIIDASEDQFILAINGDWGTGKTTFLNQWQALLKQESYQVVRINAWEYDYVSDPFLPIISAILSQINFPEGKIDDISEGLRKCANIIIKSIEGFVSTHIGERATRDIKQECQNKPDYTIIDDFTNYTKELSNFKEALTAYANSLKENSGKKLLIFVDELDRCKPTYAIEMLERIKHLFYVPNIVFVLAINNKVMEESVRCFYGCEDVNAADYLRRFYDISVTLPAPKRWDGYLYYLFDKYGINAYIDKYYDYRHSEFQRDLYQSSLHCFSHTKNSARDIERFFAMFRLILGSLNLQTVRMYLLFAYTYLFMFNKPVYDNIKSHQLSVRQLGDKLVSIFLLAKSDSDGVSGGTIAFVISILVEYARNDSNLDEGQRLLIEQEIMLSLSVIPNRDENWYKQIISNSWREMRGDNNLFDRIELVECWGRFE